MPRTTKRRTRRSSRTNADPVRMSDVQCDNLSYRFRVALDKFDLERFRSELHVEAGIKRQFWLLSTRDTKVADYHGHLEWRLREREKEISLEIQYVASPWKTENDQEPYSDDAMRWVGQFFRHQDANARVHSDFTFPVKTIALSWFPLPWRMNIPKLGEEALLDGISVGLPSQRDQVARFFLSQIKDSVFVGIESERRIKFADFVLGQELRVERAFADKLVEVK
jgi:hypothetical protein